MNWVTELLYPTIYTIIGAVIGGLFAYYIAKRNFSIDRKNEGLTYAALLSMYAGAIEKQCVEVLDFLDGWDPENEKQDRMTVLSEKSKLLQNEMASFADHWSKYKESIQYCSLEHVCREKRKRAQYAHIAEKSESICVKISAYTSFTKKIQKEYHKMNLENQKDECIKIRKKYKEFLTSPLNRLKGECADIQNLFSKLKEKKV